MRILEEKDLEYFTMPHSRHEMELSHFKTILERINSASANDVNEAILEIKNMLQRQRDETADEASANCCYVSSLTGAVTWLAGYRPVEALLAAGFIGSLAAKGTAEYHPLPPQPGSCQQKILTALYQRREKLGMIIEPKNEEQQSLFSHLRRRFF